jgi:hypothetical protein
LPRNLVEPACKSIQARSLVGWQTFNGIPDFFLRKDLVQLREIQVWLMENSELKGKVALTCCPQQIVVKIPCRLLFFLLFSFDLITHLQFGNKILALPLPRMMVEV